MGVVLSSTPKWRAKAIDKRRVQDAEVSQDALTMYRYPPLGPNPDTPNAVTGLTPRQARAVLVTFDMVRPNMKQHGVGFFIKLFKSYPDIQSYFKDVDNRPPDSLVNDPCLAAHASTVMNAIASIVDNLGDTAVLSELLTMAGKNHKKRGIPKKNFVLVREVLLLYLGEQLGEEWTPAALEGWQLALAAVNSVLFAAYDE